jgi:hypothetical protein
MVVEESLELRNIVLHVPIQIRTLDLKCFCHPKTGRQCFVDHIISHHSYPTDNSIPFCDPCNSEEILCLFGYLFKGRLIRRRLSP